MDPYQILRIMLALLLMFIEELQTQKGRLPKSKKDWFKDHLGRDFSVRMGPFRISFEGGVFAT